jgi:CHAD domain-containing protein
MVTRRQIKKWTRKRFSILVQHIVYYGVLHQPDDLHEVRVQLKRLSALFFLCKKLGWKVTGEKAVRELFKHAGTIRSAHVHLAISEKWKMNDIPLADAQKTTIHTENELFSLKESYYISSMERICRKLCRNCRKISKRQWRRFFSAQIAILKTAFANQSDPDQLHDQRKRIKRLIYLMELLPSKAAKKANFQVKKMDQLQDKIGNWHDLEMILEELRFHQNKAGVLEVLTAERNTMKTEITGLIAATGKKLKVP